MSRFVDDRHTLYVGWVLGIASSNGIDAAPVLDDEGNYTDRLKILLADGGDQLVNITVLVPPPPADWQLGVASSVEEPARPGGRGYPMSKDTPTDWQEWPELHSRHGPPCERCGSSKSVRVHTPEGPWLCWTSSGCRARIREAARKAAKSET